MPKLPLADPSPDIRNFISVIKGEIAPERPPLVELFLDYVVEREIGTSFLGLNWVEPSDKASHLKYLKNKIEVYYRMGYDYVRIDGGVNFPGDYQAVKDTADLTLGDRNWANEAGGPIASWEDYERYPWPDVAQFDLTPYEYASENLPDGVGMFVCPTSGFLEIPLDTLFGYQRLCYLMYDNPELVSAVFQRVGEIIYGIYSKLVDVPKVCGFFQGDDMGFKTGTLVGPDDLRTYVLPWHKKLAELAHSRDMVYLLHSCGNLSAIADDLIEDVKIDGRHSYEDEGNSVLEFKQRYGDRVSVLGGIDIDKLARLPEDQLRSHVRGIIEACIPGGRFAVGSGNTVCNYVPISNYFAMVEEALNFGR